MNILCVSPSTPIPITGGRRHVYQVLKHLSSHNAIHLVCAEDKPLEKELLSKYSLSFLQTCISCKIRYTSSKSEKIISTLGIWSEFNRYNTKEIIKNIQEVFQSSNPDIIIIQELCMVEPTINSLSGFKSLHNIPIICVAHNDEALLVKSKGMKKNIFLRLLYNSASASAKRYQSKWFKRTNAVACLTPEDYSSIQHSLGKNSLKLYQFGNGVDTTQFTVSSLTNQPENSGNLLFMGDYSYPPNFDSILWFIKSVLPNIKQKLILIGLPPTDKEIKLLTSNPQVNFEGLVDDVRPYLEQADICIAPILSGSGSRLKILEYLSMGKIILSTSLGVKGLNLEPGKHFIECNSPEDFISNCKKYSLNPDQFSSLKNNGRNFVVQNWDWNVLIPRFESFLLDLLQNNSKNI